LFNSSPKDFEQDLFLLFFCPKFIILLLNQMIYVLNKMAEKISFSFIANYLFKVF